MGAISAGGWRLNFELYGRETAHKCHRVLIVDWGTRMTVYLSGKIPGSVGEQILGGAAREGRVTVLATHEKGRLLVKTTFSKTGGMDGTRTRDLLRDRQTL